MFAFFARLIVPSAFGDDFAGCVRLVTIRRRIVWSGRISPAPHVSDGSGTSMSCRTVRHLRPIAAHGTGRPVRNMKKFEEGVFSDLRNLKPGTDACLEEPKVGF